MNVQSFDTYANARRFERYVMRIAPIIAADPLAHLERVLRGVQRKRDMRPALDPPDHDQFTGSYADLSRGF